MKVCKVKRVVILWDGDCRDIHTEAVLNKSDLSKRPNLFYTFARTIKELIFEFISAKQIQVYFATINTYELDGAPKGIDDLLIMYKSVSKEIVKQGMAIGLMPSSYFHWENISNENGIKKMRAFFQLRSVNEFYQFHADKIKDKNFVWFGSTYKVTSGKPEIEVSSEIKRYKNIGTNFYKLIDTPVPIGKRGETVTEVMLKPWTLEQIKRQHGKEVINKIEFFEGFTNIASHTDYQPIINNHWNLYHEVNHQAVEGDFPIIRGFLKHIFEEHYENEMILDYLSLLYCSPMQKLPILCLVSKIQGTGKSTFMYLLKRIFKQNMTTISNKDLTGEFNSNWSSKLIVACEETMVDKKDGYEKLKDFSTREEITRNEKNKPQEDIPCMIHFVICSNHEDDFIKIDDYDSRLWIRKVKKIDKNEKITNHKQKMAEEIPHFVYFLQNRQIKYEDIGERFWFHPNDFQTDAFKNLVQHSEPNVIKEIRLKLEDYFHRFPSEKVELTANDLRSHFQIKGEDHYLNKVIKNYLKVNRWQNDKGVEQVTTYSYWVQNPSEPEKSQEIKQKGRPFVFYKSDFLKGEVIHEPDPVAEQSEFPFKEA